MHFKSRFASILAALASLIAVASPSPSPASDDESTSGGTGAAKSTSSQIILPFSTTEGCPLVEIEFGSKRTAMKVLIDTGASTSWVRSSLCEEGEHCNQEGAPKLEVPLDEVITGLVNKAEVTNIKYGDSSMVNCVNVIDSHYIAGIELKNHAVCAATGSWTPIPRAFDGNMGLNTFEGDEPTDIIGSLLKQNTPKGKRLIHFWFDPNKPGYSNPENIPPSTLRPPTADAGEIIFGSRNTVKCPKAPAIVKVGTGQVNWLVPFESFKFGDNEPIKVPGGDQLALIDSGASLIHIQSDLMDKIDSLVEKQGLYFFDSIQNNDREIGCDEVKSFPTITFTFGGKPFELTWEAQFYMKGQSCYWILVGGPTDFTVVGTSFMRNFCTSFDFEKREIGFGELARKVEPPTFPAWV